jgi:serine/threonine protein kinase
MSPTDRLDDEDTLIPWGGMRSPEFAKPAPVLGASSQALPIGTRLGEFEIAGIVGEGGFGIVYLAEDRSLGRRVAIKEYMPRQVAVRSGSSVAVSSAQHAGVFETGLRSFINEAQLLALFDHPSLVKVHRFWQENGTAYIVMPYYEGRTLKAALHSRHEVPDEGRMKQLLRPLLDALAVIHRATCFHRDISPDNILILADGVPLLLDFGAARQVLNETRTLTVILKEGYAPIEQYADLGPMKQGPWTDIYALAAVVYFTIVGKAPPSSIARMVADPMVPLAEAAAGRFGDRFLRAVDRALAIKPEDRPQSAAEFAEALGLDATQSDEHEGDDEATRTSAWLSIIPGDPLARSTGARPVPSLPTRPGPVTNRPLTDRPLTSRPLTDRPVTTRPLPTLPGTGPRWTDADPGDLPTMYAAPAASEMSTLYAAPESGDGGRGRGLYYAVGVVVLVVAALAASAYFLPVFRDLVPAPAPPPAAPEPASLMLTPLPRAGPSGAVKPRAAWGGAVAPPADPASSPSRAH